MDGIPVRPITLRARCCGDALTNGLSLIDELVDLVRGREKRVADFFRERRMIFDDPKRVFQSLFGRSPCGYLLNRSTRKEEAQLKPWK